MDGLVFNCVAGHLLRGYEFWGCIVKSRPMIFSAPMVRALLAGKKTQTRRVFKAANEFETDCEPVLYDDLWRIYDSWGDGVKNMKCPYGVIGDRLWVRETYHPIYPQDPTYNNGNPIEYDYAADYKHGNRMGDTLGIKKLWKTPLFMPRAASRIELEITGIRVERVQDITDADALAEGVEVCDVERGLCAEEEYSVLWTQIHGYDEQKGWNANPWVWVVEFKVVGDCHE